ncbi:MAG: branched-chain alpha-keto acid dehydrogenase subunit E2 [Gammaproteobacteria bacterium]|jgi:pyruvate dehydrogenase E2 component (dihydrolipoamide acetyltransferase)|nr:branched-chain alpha-keto acid dehydrogenase subunit E2 [Gammaproteobacteria bacterium]
MSTRIEITVPDIGDFDKVPVIEILAGEGDTIEAEQSLVTLESDKATMEVPATRAGKLVELKVSEGDEVSEGDVIGILEVSEDEAEGHGDDAGAGDEENGPGFRGQGSGESSGDPDEVEKSGVPEGTDEAASPETRNLKPETSSETGNREPETDEQDSRQTVPGWEDDLPPPPVPFDNMDHDSGSLPHASPSVRRLARELGVDLTGVSGSGRKGRITATDLKQHVSERLSAPAGAPAAGAGMAVAEAPEVDFSRYGPVEEEALPRIKRISGPNLHRNWVTIPHVTHFDEADITDMEAFRKASRSAAEDAGTKLTPLVFQIKAVVAALGKFPHFNASLSNDGERLIRKHYFHIGVAVDTPNGLVVPVVRDCDRKGLIELAQDLTDLSRRAREGKLKSQEMKGGCLTISSLGGIGGTGFTPIINAPELAILGVSRAVMKPVWDGEAFEPGLMLPLALSYDHRVIDGADAARFTRYLATQLEDVRRLLL